MIETRDRNVAIGLAATCCGGFLAWQLYRSFFAKKKQPPPIRKVVKKYSGYNGVPTRWTVIGGAGALGESMVRYLTTEVPGVERVTSFDLNHTAVISPMVHSLQGSVLDSAAVQAAIAGSDVVVLMIKPRIHSATWNQFSTINILGVQNVLNAAQSSESAKKVVFISSTAVYDHYKPHINVDESFPLPPYFEYQTAYDLTKRIGEDLVLSANGLGGVHTVALRPSGILIGPADYSLESILKHNVSAVEGATIDFTYGLNVCHAVVLAASALASNENAARVSGRALLISKGKPVSPGQMARDLDRLIGPTISYLPRIILHAIFLCSMIQGAIDSMRKPAEAVAIPTHRFLAMANFVQTFNNDLAKKLLGFEPLYTYEEGLANIAAEHLENICRSKS